MNAYDNPGIEGPPPLNEPLCWQAQPGIAEDLAEAVHIDHRGGVYR